MTEFTRERLLERAAFIDRQIETWKGIQGYADTLRMEAAALRFMAVATAATEADPALASLRLDLGAVTDGDKQPVVDNAIIFFIGADEESNIEIRSPRAREIAERLIRLWNGARPSV